MSVKNLLQSIIPTLRVVQIGLETLDTNDTGLDDAAAKQINGGVVAIQAYLDSFPASTIAKGYAETKAFCDNVLNSLEIILASDISRDEKRAQAVSLLASLTDDSKLYPAKKGKDGDLIDKTLTQVRAKIELI
jgi:hypothetical protein